MTEPDSQSTAKDKTFEEEGRALIGIRVRYTCYFTISLFLIYNLLDRVMFPQLSTTLLYLRIFVALFHTILYFSTFSRFGKKHPVMIGILTYTSIGWIIVTMCLLTGGHRSSYYAGLILVTIGFGIMMPWRLKDATLTALLINGGYMGAVFFFDKITDLPLFVNNNFFLWGTSVISVLSSKIWEGYRLREFKDKQLLKELDKAKSTFFANVSHELKTPMTLVVTPLEYAFEKITPGVASVSIPLKLFETVRQNAYRLSSRISDLMDLTKHDVGKAVIQAAEIQEPGEYFGKIFQSVRSLMEKKGILCDYSCEGVGGAKTLKPHCFDKTKMDKVVVNLLTNAVKFTPSGGKISLRAWDIPPHPPLNLRGGEEGEILKIEVSDTGIGIPAENLASVFERFVQVDSSSTRSYGGMGIGLSLVKEFVDQHGGHVWVESEEGKGTKFFVELPRGRHHFRVPVAEVQKGDIGSGVDLPESPLIPTITQPQSGKTVLVVDDNSDMRLAVRQVLEEHYHVLEASDGEEGIRVVMEKRPDLVISDIMMPRKDGYGLVRDIRACSETKEIPVIFLTAKSGEEILAQGFRVGPDDYISKPFQPKELLASVEKMIRNNSIKGVL